MADAIQDHERQVKALKRLLEGWRMAILPLKSVMLWEQQWHPAVLLASVSVIYFLIWLLDLNMMTTIAFVGLLLNFVDFSVPIVCNTIYGPNSWTGQKEKVFEETCRSIVVQYNNAFAIIRNFCAMRQTTPWMYYTISIGLLLTFAWISSAINNICLLYMLSAGALLWPGLQEKGLMKPLLALIKKAPKSIKPE